MPHGAVRRYDENRRHEIGTTIKKRFITEWWNTAVRFADCPATYHPVGGGVPDAPHMEANNFFSVVRLKTAPWRKGTVFPTGKRHAGRRDAAPYGWWTNAEKNGSSRIIVGYGDQA